MSVAIVTREATMRSVCPFSSQVIYPGDRITKYTQQQHDAFIASIKTRLPDHLINAIIYSSNGVNTKIGRWGLDAHTNWLAKKSSSGRTIKPVLKQEHRSFVAGSGFSGCDQYDRGYNRGQGAGVTPINNNADLKNFVVDDTQVDYDLSLQPDEEFRYCEEEWNDDETSDEEDEWSCDSDEE
uniref:Uncharacterized protein n=1 Tax=viral metagenome TaxID=1070528 RepID=A0A6C0CQR1_9ZZZZ